MAQVVYSNTTAGAPVSGRIFTSKNFFLLARVPSRSRFIADIEANGGRVVRVEEQADYVVADHARTDAPPCSISYRFIEAALRDGELPAIEDHQAGPPRGTVREVGSRAIPGKSTRTPFTAEDDRGLYAFVKEYEGNGGRVKGNEIYKQYEALNPRHTFQSWRDRYVKYLMVKPPISVGAPSVATPNTVPRNAPPTPPGEQAVRAPIRSTPAAPAATMDGASDFGGAASPIPDQPAFQQKDYDTLLSLAADIQQVSIASYRAAWQEWAKANPSHSAKEWQDYFESTVLPVHEEREKQDAALLEERAESIQFMKGKPPKQDIKVEPTAAAGQAASVSDRKRKMTDEDGPEEGAAPKKQHVDVARSASAAHMEKDIPKYASPVTKKQASASGGDQRVNSVLDNACENIAKKVEERKAAAGTGARLPIKSEPVLKEPPTRIVEKTENENVQVIDLTEDNQETSQETDDQEEEPRQDMATSEADLMAQEQLRQGLQQEHMPALTAENLAQMQGIEKQEPTSRGVDLPEDDPNHDQEDFAHYLESLVKPRDHNRPSSRPTRDSAVREPEVAESPEAIRERVARNQAIADEEVNGNMQPETLNSDDSLYANDTMMRQHEDENEDDVSHSVPVALEPRRKFQMPFSIDTSSPARQYNDSPPVDDDDDADPTKIDLDIPEPEGGFDALSSQAEELDLPSIASESRRNARNNNTLDTQAIYAAETQDLDFDVPEPEDDLVEPWSEIKSEGEDQQPDGADSQTLSNDDMNAYIERMVEAGHGAEDVEDALYYTSWRPEKTEIVLRAIQRRLPVPTGIAGIWSKKEDEMVEGNDANALKRLARKHGDEEVDARMQWLSEYRDANGIAPRERGGEK